MVGFGWHAYNQFDSASATLRRENIDNLILTLSSYEIDQNFNYLFYGKFVIASTTKDCNLFGIILKIKIKNYLVFVFEVIY